jgi:hypothetical protein
MGFCGCRLSLSWDKKKRLNSLLFFFFFFLGTFHDFSWTLFNWELELVGNYRNFFMWLECWYTVLSSVILIYWCGSCLQCRSGNSRNVAL